jgi:succinate-semialdehyde dehydrogenase/glutarate-semialdehyde dehydrogenase
LIEWAVVGRINNGESCVASKRFIAVEAIRWIPWKFKEKIQLNCWWLMNSTTELDDEQKLLLYIL